MITVISRFPVGASEEATAKFRESVPRYQAVPGLLRKHYYVDGEGYGGGVYLFRSREDAQALFTEAFSAAIKERFGAAPTVTYLPTVIIIDNETGAVIHEDAPQ